MAIATPTTERGRRTRESNLFKTLRDFHLPDFPPPREETTFLLSPKRSLLQ